MSSTDYHGVVDRMRLENGFVWTIPISLDVDRETYCKADDSYKFYLTHKTSDLPPKN